MFDIIAESTAPAFKNSKKITIEQKADNVEELFVNWLNELLSLSATKELIFTGFNIRNISETALQATVSGASVDFFKVNVEIKAATYHALKVSKSLRGWKAEVILDV